MEHQPWDASSGPGDGETYDQHLTRLREDYVRASFKQRLFVIGQRLTDEHYGPNRIATEVAAVEAFARSLVVHTVAVRDGKDVMAVYSDFERARPEKLIGTYLGEKGLGRPEEFFGSTVWTFLLLAVRYRDLVTHEATYLDWSMIEVIVRSCRFALYQLADTVGLGAEVPKAA